MSNFEQFFHSLLNEFEGEEQYDHIGEQHDQNEEPYLKGYSSLLFETKSVPLPIIRELDTLSQFLKDKAIKKCQNCRTQLKDIIFLSPCCRIYCHNCVHASFHSSCSICSRFHKQKSHKECETIHISSPTTHHSFISDQ